MDKNRSTKYWYSWIDMIDSIGSSAGSTTTLDGFSLKSVSVVDTFEENPDLFIEICKVIQKQRNMSL